MGERDYERKIFDPFFAFKEILKSQIMLVWSKKKAYSLNMEPRMSIFSLTEVRTALAVKRKEKKKKSGLNWC